MSLPALCHGIIAGLVVVASGSPVIEPYAAVIAGCIGAAIYVYGDRWLLVSLRVDDATACIATQVGLCWPSAACLAGWVSMCRVMACAVAVSLQGYLLHACMLSATLTRQVAPPGDV
jgi:hypothetical protein